ALSVGLILNELVTNSLKYAFPDNRKGSIGITLERKNGDIIIEVSDDGIGTPSDFAIENSKGLGMSLVNLLTKQINGNLIKANINNGTLFRVRFPYIKAIP
ncbi:sensor histidine kinase, partial [bacterium]|nr:sensor histidine kinase [bacterium]